MTVAHTQLVAMSVNSMGITKKTTPCLNWPNNSLMNAQTVNNPAIGPPIQKSKGVISRAVNNRNRKLLIRIHPFKQSRQIKKATVPCSK